MGSVEFSSWLRRGASRVNGNRVVASALLLTAVILGAWLRFQWLSAEQLTDDEGASWAAAHLHHIPAVIAAEPVLDPGKLAFYDVALHLWIRAFGDSLTAMRSLSALFGIATIMLVFVAVREICLTLSAELPAELGEMAGAVAALLVAANPTLVDSARAARMYSMLSAVEIAQIAFFVRAQRWGKLSDYGGIAVCTAIAVALNFTAAFLLIAEALWLSITLGLELSDRNRLGLRVFGPGLAVTAGLVLLAPFMPTALATAYVGMRFYLGWIQPQPLSWTYQVLQQAADPFFAVLLAVGVLGLILGWRRGYPLSGVFIAVAWLTGPILACVLVTILVHPLEISRYVTISFVGLFALAGLGIASLRSKVLAVIFTVFLAANWTSVERRNIAALPGAYAWKEAVNTANPDGNVAVFPDYTINVIRYYLGPKREKFAVPANELGCASSPTLIMSGRIFMPAADLAAQDKCYPNLVERFNGVEVRRK